MLFNSLSFAIFLPVVFFLYWFVTNRSLRLQNILLLVASYFFYACWDWRFLFLLLFTTLLDYFTGRKMPKARSQGMKRFWLWLSVSVNVGFLGVFKYLPGTVTVILPVGISFYTFHGLSYVFDVYKGKIDAEKNLVDYAVFVSFFPLLVAGPIERAWHLLPQIRQRREFDYAQAIDGLKQMLWGFFKKIVIADVCAAYVNIVFNDPAHQSGSSLVLGALLFTVQIYCDFSGYSDIAIGTARLFGVHLLRNFAFPYFSRDIAEFWRRWHISLSSWFRDYLYIPLGGSRGGRWQKFRNTLIIFLVSAFWHGANWTFICWGLLNAVYIMPAMVFNRNRNYMDIVARDRLLPNFKEVLQMSVTFGLTVFAWIFFRSKDLGYARIYISRIFTTSLFSIPEVRPPSVFLLLILLFFIIEWFGRRQRYAIEALAPVFPRVLRWGLYYSLTAAILYYSGVEERFIYFQF